MVHVIISGFVQGIGFRQFIKSNANKLDVKGWVKNLPASRQGGPDGRVEAMFAGESSNIEKMLDFCRQGPFLAEVKSLQVEKLPDQKFHSFDIIKE